MKTNGRWKMEKLTNLKAFWASLCPNTLLIKAVPIAAIVKF